MDPQLLELAALFQSECPYVLSTEQLPTKVRFTLNVILEQHSTGSDD